MQIDYALILSAGLGTRMGEIGKTIPKVLWPVYFKTLLELQIRYCQDLGIQKIYINTHYLHEEIQVFLSKSNLLSSVTLLYENPLLDSGGAIHNLAKRKEINYHGSLLLVNGDQFLFFEKKFWIQAIDRLNECRALLFGIMVDKNAAYNETITENDRLIEIKKNIEKNHDYVTYSGLGILKLDNLKPVAGISRFFETVANFHVDKVEMLTPSMFEYWDFGTADIYAKSIFKLKEVEQRESLMGQFLKKYNAFSGNEDLFVDSKRKSIDLDIKKTFSENSIHAGGYFQKI